MNTEEEMELLMPKKQTIKMFDGIQAKICKFLPTSKVYLIGSMAVPMLGRDEMDIIVEADNVEKTQNLLVKNGFSKGSITDGLGFCKARSHGISLSVHIVPSGHQKIQNCFDTTRKLQEDEDLKHRLEDMKLSQEGKTIDEYKKAKTTFLKENGLL